MCQIRRAHARRSRDVSQVSAVQAGAAMLAAVARILTGIGRKVTAIGQKDTSIEGRRAPNEASVSGDSRWYVVLERMRIMVGRRLTTMNEGWQRCDEEWLIRMGAELPQIGDRRILNEWWRHANGR